MPHARISIALLFLALALAWPAQAREYVVGVEDLYYRPFYYLEHGQYRGVAHDILQAWAKKKGLVLKFKPLPVNRLYREFLAGRLDFKFPDNPAWKPEWKKGKTIFYSGPVVRFVDGVMVTPDRRGKGLGRLKVLGTVLGFTPFSYLGLIKQGKVRVVENASFAGLLGQVIKGRIDGAYMNPVVARYQLEAVLKQPGALVFDPGLPHISDSYRLSSAGHPGLIKKFNRFLGQEKAILKAIKARYRLGQR